MRVVSIHQPNFFPWLGYFDKINRSDVFIFLDDVQFPKKGGNWSNRVKLKVSEEAKYVTAPIDRNYAGTRLVNQIKYLHGTKWQKKFISTLIANYRRYPHFNSVMQFLEPLVFQDEDNVSKFNQHVIREVCSKINISSGRMILSSELEHEGASNQLLCSLTKSVDGGIYMCGGGADGYQDEDVFRDEGILLMHQNFKHPSYPQPVTKSFIPGLSIIDALMSVGFDQCSELLRK